MYKKFDTHLYQQNDDAKLVAIEYFTSIGKRAIVNPDDYGIDLIVDGDFYCEVEVKHNWKGDTFPFDTLQIPLRKMKFTNLDKRSYFMVMNSDRTRAIVIKAEDLLDSRIVNVPNKYLEQGEQFFQVPKSKFRFLSFESRYKWC